MQTWNLQKRQQRTASSSSPLLRRVTRVFSVAAVVVVVCAAVLYAVPWSYNLVDRALFDRLPNQETVEPYRLGLDLQGGTQLTYDADTRALGTDTGDALEGVRDVIERRVNAFGVGEPRVQIIENGNQSRLLVELPGVTDVNEAIRQIGETPILEFKEPGFDLSQGLTEEQTKQKATLEAEAKAAAEALLLQARNGATLESLVKEGEVVWSSPTVIAKNAPQIKAIVEAIDRLKPQVGSLLSEVVETSRGLEIVRYLGAETTKEFDLSHILVCFEGKTGCQNPIPALDASLQLQELKQQANPENFAELARMHSTDTGSGAEGGSLGWATADRYVDAFALAATTLPVGQISDIVETELGYHLILKKGERPTDGMKLERLVSAPADLSTLFTPDQFWKLTELSGKHLTRAQVQFDPQTNQPLVGLQFNSEGADLFAELTSRLATSGGSIAIFLDQNPEPISVARVNEPIYGGQAVIQGGDLDLEASKELAQRLNAGALPVAITLASEQTIGPSLGIISLHQSLIAALVGFALVAVFMIIVYRLPGVLAVLALTLYAILNLAAYRFFGVTITLASIAGFVLSLGIAVDANVLIFERFKEEWNAGHDLAASLELGFKRAWSAIRDGNVTTLIATAVLYLLSTSFIQGFALTLSIGVLLSMATAFVVTRTLARWCVKRTVFAKRLPWFGLAPRT